MASGDDIKKIFREEISDLMGKYKLDDEDVEKIISVFELMYEKNCEEIKDSFVYLQLTKSLYQ